VRHIQDARKNADFAIEDRIAVTYRAGPETSAVFASLGSYIAAETLADALRAGPAEKGAHTEAFKLGSENVEVSVRRIE
jgi:hypothetical protein